MATHEHFFSSDNILHGSVKYQAESTFFSKTSSGQLCPGPSQHSLLQLGQLHTPGYSFYFVAELDWRGHSGATTSHGAPAELC